MKPISTATHAESSPSLRLHIDMQPPNANQTTNTHSPVSPERFESNKPSMSHLVSDAVKEAFMEVDDEAPGGWQGWRMWNEMVTNDDLPTSRPSGLDVVNDGMFEANWNTHLVNSVVCGIDPVQNAAMHLRNNDMLDQNFWDLSGCR